VALALKLQQPRRLLLVLSELLDAGGSDWRELCAVVGEIVAEDLDLVSQPAGQPASQPARTHARTHERTHR
jgi:hypothetical protein